jgi:zinc/manganese transport system permease protein
MTLGGMIAGITVVLFSALVSRLTTATEEASLAAFYLISLALGVLIITASGSQLDLLHILFGSALSLDGAALHFLVAISTLTWCTLALIYRPLILECVDRPFLQSVSGLSPYVHFTFLILVVLNLVAGFNALGTLMSVGMMILPAAIAKYWFKRLDSMLLAAIILGSAASYLGLLMSFALGWSTGPTIVLVLGIGYLLSTILGAQDGLVKRWVRPRHLSG